MRWRLGWLPEPGGGDEAALALSGVQILTLSFLGLILIGTLGLLLLPGLYTGPHLGVIDALFTATSAVCVTGLIVVDTATAFTTLGQVWIACLIQLGGLGILTFATLLISLVGGRVTLSMEEAAGAPAERARLAVGALVRSVVLLTLAVEATGALALWLLWGGRFGAADAAWPAVFHAISAFCNAGFSVFSDSLAGVRDSVGTLMVVGALVVLGGLGFIVLTELRHLTVARFRRRLSLHTTIVLVTTAVLLLGGTGCYLLFEAGNALAGDPWPVRLANAAFMSVTARTAGFNTVPYDAVSNPSVFLTIVLMLVGGGPGSTAGGLKVTTVALLALLMVSRMRGRQEVSVGARTIPADTVGRATSVTLGGLALLGIAFLVLLISETPAEVADRTHLTRVVFEASSAFGTVGLSMGLTAGLTAMGKLVMVVLMYLGRLGPLTMVAAMVFAGRRRALQYRYAHEDIVVG